MSRVFVSCSYRDRTAGAELGRIVRSLGHEALDDLDEARGTAWWNEVVGRIEASDVFVAVASPSYAEAHSCRLAAKHAAATGLPVVRVDLDGKQVQDCHPVVAEAVGVDFAPDDPQTVVRLAHVLTGSSDEPATEIRTTTEPSTASERSHPPPPPAPSVEPDHSVGRFSSLEVVAAVAMLLVAAGLLYVGLHHRGDPDPPTSAPTAVPIVTPRGTPAPSADPPETPGPAGGPVDVLAEIKAVRSDRLPASSCEAGADTVTCSNPVPNIRAVVLTPYPTSSELYAAYTAAVEQLSGDPGLENTGNCSLTESEGEVGWNLDRLHTRDFPIAEQELGELDPVSESAGRVFCTVSHGVMRLVWTQDPGLLGTATGHPAEPVVDWWSEVHLRLVCAGGADGNGCV